MDCFCGRHLDLEICVLKLDICSRIIQWPATTKSCRILGQYRQSLVQEELPLHGDLQTAILVFFT